MKDLAGKVAVITGGASGIGLATARVFAREGMKLVLADIEDGPLDAAVEELRTAGAEVIGVEPDVANHADVGALGGRTCGQGEEALRSPDLPRPRTIA